MTPATPLSRRVFLQASAAGAAAKVTTLPLRRCAARCRAGPSFAPTAFRTTSIISSASARK